MAETVTIERLLSAIAKAGEWTERMAAVEAIQAAIANKQLAELTVAAAAADATTWPLGVRKLLSTLQEMLADKVRKN